MAEEGPTGDFGKRRPVATMPPRLAKRSGHVVLLLMGSLAVGGGAYALIPEACEPTSPGMAAPATPQASAACARGSSGGGGGHQSSSHFSYYGGDSSNKSSSAGPSDSASGGVTRGGFGSFARAFGLTGG